MLQKYNFICKFNSSLAHKESIWISTLENHFSSAVYAPLLLITEVYRITALLHLKKR